MELVGVGLVGVGTVLWFSHHRFLYPAQCVDPRKSFAETFRHEKWARITCQIDGECVSLQHKQPRFFHNYWNPLFEGRFVIEGSKHYLSGYFRPSWMLFILNLLIMGFAAYRFVSIFLASSNQAENAEVWSDKELIWQALFLSGLVLLMFFGWLIGVPYERRILAAIRESTAHVK